MGMGAQPATKTTLLGVVKEQRRACRMSGRKCRGMIILDGPQLGTPFDGALRLTRSRLQGW